MSDIDAEIKKLSTFLGYNPVDNSGKMLYAQISELGFSPLRNLVENIIKQKSIRLGGIYGTYLHGHKEYATNVILPKLEYLKELLLATNVARMMPYDKKLEANLFKTQEEAVNDVKKAEEEYLKRLKAYTDQMKVLENRLVTQPHTHFGDMVGSIAYQPSKKYLKQMGYHGGKKRKGSKKKKVKKTKKSRKM